MGKLTNNIKRAKYGPQFKDQVLERAAKDGVKKAAKDLGLAESLIYSWRAKREQGQSPLETQKLQQAEFSRLKRENARLALENAFLKKAAAESHT
ncbi:MAG: transposase [Gammaproteobacteria bacterium]